MNEEAKIKDTISRLMKENHVKLQDVADALFVGKSAVSKLLNPREGRRLDIDTIQKIAVVLKVDANDLLSHDGTKITNALRRNHELDNLPATSSRGIPTGDSNEITITIEEYLHKGIRTPLLLFANNINEAKDCIYTAALDEIPYSKITDKYTAEDLTESLLEMLPYKLYIFNISACPLKERAITTSVLIKMAAKNTNLQFIIIDRPMDYSNDSREDIYSMWAEKVITLSMTDNGHSEVGRYDETILDYMNTSDMLPLYIIGKENLYDEVEDILSDFCLIAKDEDPKTLENLIDFLPYDVYLYNLSLIPDKDEKTMAIAEIARLAKMYPQSHFVIVDEKSSEDKSNDLFYFNSCVDQWNRFFCIVNELCK